MVLAFVMIFTLAGCSKVDTMQETRQQTFDEQVDAVVESMTLPEKVGQLVMIGIHGTELNDDSRYMLNQYHIGGVLLFDRNLQSAEQTTRLTAELQGEAQKVPLLIGLDEEGGTVVRGKSFITPPPSAQSLGTAGDNTQAEAWARRTGEQLAKLGFNVNFAPVADVGDSSRDFSRDPQVVKKFVAAAAQGYESAHMIYTLKHFPGIGKGQVDSHIDRSNIIATKQQLAEEDLLPFKEIISQHDTEDFMVLMSHLIYPEIDASNPASLSPEIQTKLLRQEMGFNGVIITDDLEMGAVSKYGDFRQLGVQAVLAGADIVLVCHEYPHETDVYLGLLEAAEKGTISQERLNESVKRIVRMKLLRGNSPR